MIPGIMASGGPRAGGGGVVGGDPFYDDVLALLHLDGANGSTTFTDEKGTVWTASGDAQLATSTPKFGSAAATFDGTTDYIDSAVNAAFAFGLDDYTIECWGRFGSVAGNRALFGIGIRTTYNFNVGTPTLAVFDGAASNLCPISGHVINTYYHVAMCRAAGLLRLFVNGAQGSDFNDVAHNITANTISIARFPGFTTSTLLGFVDEFRVTRRARYTAAFTPPVAAFESFRSALVDPHYASVVALLNFEGANGQTWMLDERGNLWTRSGGSTSTMTTAQTPGFGTSSWNDAGLQQYITTASKAAFGYGTGDFTIEFFMRATTLGGVQIFYDQRTTLSQARPAIYHNSGGDIRYFVSGADRILGAGGSLVLNTWHHVALCRASGSTRLFVDGVQKGSTYADATNYEASLIILGNAGDQLGSSFGHVGQYKGLRVTKGVARYTANFSPPTALFPNS